MPCARTYLLLAAVSLGSSLAAQGEDRHAVPREHPRLFGSRERLVRLAEERPEAYRRVVAVARGGEADDHTKVVSLSLVAAIEEDEALAREAKAVVMRYVDGPIRVGHTPFAADLALAAIAYDHGHAVWSDGERQRLVEYINRTVDANVDSETHVFHNGWYGYKNWGIGLACYATYYENPRAAEILAALEEEFRERAAPALERAGAGGGWAEGYYIHYWLYEWLVFCEVARRCEGIDYYALAPRFFEQRAVAGMFEMYPGIAEYGSRRPVPMGDGGGRRFGGDRDKALSARRILVNRFRDDPAHRAVHAFNETTPRSSVGNNAYKDFLWRDTTVPPGDLEGFPLAHHSSGPGHVYARSAWDEDATYFFFRAGSRFTAHQHLDNAHFVFFKHAELAGDGGHYDGFGTRHDVNYHLRTIAHNTILVLDPEETWPGIRAGTVTGNDGGQHHDWPHHNGAVADAEAWHARRDLYEVARITAFEDRGDYLYLAADATRSYRAAKLEEFTRQIVYLRPDTFVIFDRVRSTRPELKKTWLLHAMRVPDEHDGRLVVTHGPGRLFIETLLPATAETRLAHGDDLYRYDGQHFPPARDTGPAPQCRIEISPGEAARQDFFLHVLTTADAATDSVPRARASAAAGAVEVTVGTARVTFAKDRLDVAVRP